MPAKKPSSQEIEASEPASALPKMCSVRFPVVGIGASAGGLEAATIFFKELSPHLGMAYVLVLHLDPARESEVAEILARTTVHAGGPGHRRHARGARSRLCHSPELRNDHRPLGAAPAHRDPQTVANTTIDTFLRSLAVSSRKRRHWGYSFRNRVRRHSRSGGHQGRSGITFAQEPTSARYDGMPASAIASGCVDFILTPVGIAQEIARIRQHPYIADRLNLRARRTATTSDMEQIFRLMRRIKTVDFSGYKSPTIGRRIQRRMALQKIERLRIMRNLLHRDRREMEALYQDLLINVTSFFRNPEAFAALRQRCLSSHFAGANLQLWPDSHLGSWMLDGRRGVLARDLDHRVSGGSTSRYSHPGLRHRLERERHPTRQGRRI